MLYVSTLRTALRVRKYALTLRTQSSARTSSTGCAVMVSTRHSAGTVPFWSSSTCAIRTFLKVETRLMFRYCILEGKTIPYAVSRPCIRRLSRDGCRSWIRSLCWMRRIGRHMRSQKRPRDSSRSGWVRIMKNEVGRAERCMSAMLGV